MVSTGAFPYDYPYTFLPCVFPFIFNGIKYTTCTTSGPQGENGAWCSITSNFDIDGLWGYCNQCASTCDTRCTLSLGGRENPSCVSAALSNGWGYCDPQIDYSKLNNLTATSTPTPTPTTSGNLLSTPIIVAIAVGGAVAILLAALAVFLYLDFKKRSKLKKDIEALVAGRTSISGGSASTVQAQPFISKKSSPFPSKFPKLFHLLFAFH